MKLIHLKRFLFRYILVKWHIFRNDIYAAQFDYNLAQLLARYPASRTAATHGRWPVLTWDDKGI